MEGLTNPTRLLEGSPGQGFQSVPSPAAEVQADRPDRELVALLIEHMQALLKQQAREFGGGGGGSGDLTPRTVLRLQQQHVKLREAAAFLSMVMRAGVPGETGRSLGETGWGLEETTLGLGDTRLRLGEPGSSLRGSEISPGKSEKCLEEGEPNARRAATNGPSMMAPTSEGLSSGVSEAGSDGRNPTAGFRQTEYPTEGGRLQDQQTAGAELRAQERLFALRLRSLRHRKPVNQMTFDDFRELMDVFRRNGPATQQPPTESAPQVSGITHERSAARNSLAPGSLAGSGGNGVKRPHSRDSYPTRKRGVTDWTHISAGGLAAKGAEETTLALPSCRSPSPSRDGKPDISTPEGSLCLSLCPPESHASPRRRRIDLNRAPFE